MGQVTTALRRSRTLSLPYRRRQSAVFRRGGASQRPTVAPPGYADRGPSAYHTDAGKALSSGLGSTDCRSAWASMPFVICSTGDALAFKAAVANQTSATYDGRARQGPPIGQRIETQFFGLLNAHAALADALPHCNYRVYISGNGISLVSSWMQRQLFALSFCLSQTDGRHS